MKADQDRARLTHFDEAGAARMVDVGAKAITRREAVARGAVRMQAETFRRIVDRAIEKGDVLGVARVAGIMAAKRTGELIPMCHPLGLSSVTVNFRLRPPATAAAGERERAGEAVSPPAQRGGSALPGERRGGGGVEGTPAPRRAHEATQSPRGGGEGVATREAGRGGSEGFPAPDDVHGATRSAQGGDALIEIEAVARVEGKTGVEMEALAAVSVAALTIYDMCKAVDRGMVIEGVRLVRKSGGKSGTYVRPGEVDLPPEG